MNVRALLLTTSLAAVVPGCYVPAYNTRVEHLGDVDMDADAAAEKEAASLPWDGSYGVRMVDGNLPLGLELVEGGTILQVKAGYEKRYRVVARVESRQSIPSDMRLAMRALFWRNAMHDQHSNARQVYCDVQAPLKVITLSLWNAVPLAWACFPADVGRRENRRYHLANLSRAAVAVGANMVVLASDEHGTFTHVMPVGATATSTTTHRRFIGMTGFAVDDADQDPALAFE